MAVLTSGELAELRQLASTIKVPVTWDKATVNAALQAIEDWFEANRASLGSAIETAAPGVFTNTEKKGLVKYWLRQKFNRGG
jgi:hypothetical protein